MNVEIPGNKKILYLIKTMSIGGSERFTFNLCNYFAGLFSETAVFSSGGFFEDELKKKGVQFYHSPNAAKNGLLNFFKLRHELKKMLSDNHYDIIHCQHRYFVPIVNSLKLENTKIVYTANNFFDDFYQHFIKADAITAISPGIMKNLLETNLSQKDKIVLINYGVNEITEPVSSRRFAVGYVGRLIKEKGIFELLEAVKILKSRYPEIRLIVCGDGPDKTEFNNRAIKLGLKSSIEIKNVSVNLKEIYEGIDILVLPSKMNEGLPVSVLEAMINKILVIAARCGAVEDIIEDGKTGFLLKDTKPDTIAEKIELALNSKQRDSIKSNAYDLIKDKYSLKIMLEEFAQLYSKLL